MQKPYNVNINNSNIFLNKAFEWGKAFDVFMVLNSNTHAFNGNASFLPTQYDVLIAAGCKQGSVITNFYQLQQLRYNKKWLFGHVGYEAKNELEKFETCKENIVGFGTICFLEPQIVIALIGSKVQIWASNAQQVYTNINSTLLTKKTENRVGKHDNEKLLQRVSLNKYIENINLIKQHIARGNIYELNYCIDFYKNNAIIEPEKVYEQLNTISPAPFSVYYKNNNAYLISSSPERFLKKVGNTLYSMPIKGTIKRGKHFDADQQNINYLQHNHKERAENIMITDLVRNDLAKCAQTGTVKVEELCGIYSFKHLHQMISTVSAKIEPNIHFSDVIKCLFPPGSMTGAPKYRAMQIIDEVEPVARGIYSGTVGYISPNGDFDFNVIIRSICYNKASGYLSFHVGSAITSNSIAQNEYNECMLKAKAMIMALG